MSVSLPKLSEKARTGERDAAPSGTSVFTPEALPGRVIFGAGSARAVLVEEVARLGGERILLVVAEPERSLSDPLVRPLGHRIAARFTAVRAHVPLETAVAARRAAADSEATLVLSVGGGSTTGAAKAIALELSLPIIAIPTTYAGSEMTPIWGITDGQHKRTGRDLRVVPRTVIYDPELTQSLPTATAGPSALNAMAHCVEALYTPASTPLTSVIAIDGITALGAGIAALGTHRDAEIDDRLLYGASLGGMCLALAGTGLHHKLCHVLGGAFNLPHAETHAILLPHVVAFNTPALRGTTERVACALGPAGVAGAAEGLYCLLEGINGPVGLRELGLEQDQLDDAVALASEVDFTANPRVVDRASVRSILQGAFEGRRPSSNRQAAAKGRG